MARRFRTTYCGFVSPVFSRLPGIYQEQAGQQQNSGAITCTPRRLKQDRQAIDCGAGLDEKFGVVVVVVWGGSTFFVFFTAAAAAAAKQRKRAKGRDIARLRRAEA